MALFKNGHTFDPREEVVNTKLHDLINLASISNISLIELGSELGSFGTNASYIDLSGNNVIPLYYSTYGSLSTFISPRQGQKFCVISYQASFPVLIDTGSFKLSGNWIPANQYDNITLVWDGNNYIELSRKTIT